MDHRTEINKEDLEKMIEKAKAELEARLAQMTPEERAEAERKAQKRIEEDEAERKKLLETAAKYAAPSVPKETQKTCPSCGAVLKGGNFCEYCGSPLSKTSN